ncbi:MAG: hypothetical protein AAFX52_08665 [Pseudomonadota bacterium]
MTSEMGEMFNAIRARRKKEKEARRDAFDPGPEWTRHCDTHYSRDLLGTRLDYWPGTTRFRWCGKSRHGDVMGFIKNREKEASAS